MAGCRPEQLLLLGTRELDVLDAAQFPCVMCPAPGGISMEALLRLLGLLKERFNIVGMSVLEYTPSKAQELELLEGIFKIGTELGA